MEFRIEMREWLEHEVPDPLESASLAEIAIFADDICLTQVDDAFSRTTRETIRISASGLAIWLLENFWRLRFETRIDSTLEPRFEWAMAHKLAAVGEGYMWPPLTFLGAEGEFAALSLDRTPSSAGANSVRYLNTFAGLVTSKSLEEAIFGFSETVVRRLSDVGFSDSPIHNLWNDVNEERASKKSAKFRMLEGLLGLDPDSDTKLVNALLTKWSKSIGSTAVEEISAAAGSETIEQTLKATKDAALTVKTHGHISGIDKLRAALTLADPFAPTWVKARNAAYKVRELWGVDTKPITQHCLSDNLGLTEGELSQFDARFPFSFAVSDRNNERFGFALAKERKESRRFDTVRLLGDQLFIDLTEQIKPATAATTTRQQYQRAFAAEFLCPSYVVRERCADASNMDEIEQRLDALAAEYQVNDRIVLHHWENHGLPSAQV